MCIMHRHRHALQIGWNLTSPKRDAAERSSSAISDSASFVCV